MAAADWSELPWDLLNKIVSRFGIPHDFARFKSVCSSWRSFAAAYEQVRQSSSTDPPQFFGLMLPGDEKDRRDFYSPLDGKVYKNLLRVPDYHFNGNYLDGWIINLPFSTKNVCILNPLSGDIQQMVTFPSVAPLKALHNYLRAGFHLRFDLLSWFINKAVLSANPSQSITGGRLTMMIIFGEDCRLAYAREGGEAWVVVQEVHIRSSYYDDIVYYRDGFYAVNLRGTIFFVDIDSSTAPRVRVVMSPSPEDDQCGISFFVESHDGDLLLVSKNWTKHRSTVIFRVYQLDLKNQTKIEIRDLGDASLFLGVESTSLSIPSPEKIGLRKNCIYFTKGIKEIVLFDLENRKT